MAINGLNLVKLNKIPIVRTVDFYLSYVLERKKKSSVSTFQNTDNINCQYDHIWFASKGNRNAHLRVFVD